jgi:hypothetical protein
MTRTASDETWLDTRYLGKWKTVKLSDDRLSMKEFASALCSYMNDSTRFSAFQEDDRFHSSR